MKYLKKLHNLYNMENEDEIIEQIRKTIIEIFKEECPCKKDIYFECDEKANVVKVTWIYEGDVVFGMFDNRVYVTTEESSQGWLTSFYEDVKEIADGLDKPKEEFIDEVVDYEYLTMPAERKMCWDDKEDLKKKEHVEDVDFYWTAIEYVKEKDEYLEMLEVGFDNWANDNPDFLKRAEEIFYAWKAQILKDIKEYEEREISK